MNFDNLIKEKKKLITSLFFYNIIGTISKLHFTDKEVSANKLIAYYVKEAYNRMGDDNSESYFAVAMLLASVMRMTDPLPDTTMDRVLESDDLTDDDRISVCAGFIAKANYENDESLEDDYMKTLFDLLEDYSLPEEFRKVEKTHQSHKIYLNQIFPTTVRKQTKTNYYRTF